MNELIQKARNFAVKAHDAAGCTYGDDDESYVVHLDIVYNLVDKHAGIFKSNKDALHTRAAAYPHDTIEDAQQTYNDVMEATCKEVADIVLALTDVQEYNRMLRFLSTVPKIIKDHRALILKLCDIGGNAGYGKGKKNDMYKKYQDEWAYKRYIFNKAVNWHADKYKMDKFKELLHDVDRAHAFSHLAMG